MPTCSRTIMTRWTRARSCCRDNPAGRGEKMRSCQREWFHRDSSCCPKWPRNHAMPWFSRVNWVVVLVMPCAARRRFRRRGRQRADQSRRHPSQTACRARGTPPSLKASPRYLPADGIERGQACPRIRGRLPSVRLSSTGPWCVASQCRMAVSGVAGSRNCSVRAKHQTTGRHDR